ncbi:MAG: prepilin-type N-terminal cleavage/methylation domain-containing protein [Patescibacteria group bacterium]
MSNELKSGFTLIELLVSLGIFSLIILAVAWFIISSLRYNGIIWEQLSTQNDGRRVLQEIVNHVRRAEESSIGSYPIELAAPYELIFFANVDNDSERERVRYFLAGTTIKKGVVNPTGNPLRYVTSTETLVEIAHDVVNLEQESPLFFYFNESYAGTSTPLLQPVNVTAVRMVRAALELEKDPTESPVPLHVESTVQIRNLKVN